MHFVLLYDYVPNVAERRAPFREDHLSLLRGLQERGEVIMAGGWKDPLDGAAIIFKVNSRSVVEDFVSKDPYAVNGMVTNWRIREWNVVIGG